jgi:hypothetical protein
MKMYVCGNGSTAPPFLTSGLDESELSHSRPRRFTSVDKAPVSIVWEVGLDPGLVWT